VRSRLRHTEEEPGADEYIAPADYPMELVLRNPNGSGEIRLGVLASLRDLEVLGSAGLNYAEQYVNVERPYHQVVARRRRAQRVGQSLWDAAVERCGIETAETS
jgi:hypothetical protein